jgi:hypothetical protein
LTIDRAGGAGDELGYGQELGRASVARYCWASPGRRWASNRTRAAMESARYSACSRGVVMQLSAGGADEVIRGLHPSSLEPLAQAGVRDAEVFSCAVDAARVLERYDTQCRNLDIGPRLGFACDDAFAVRFAKA